MKQSELLKNIAQLDAYQKRQVESSITKFLQLNKEDENTEPDSCPYCGKHSKMIKKGFHRGKQRYQCKECFHVFSYNSNTITMYSKIERSKFRTILLDTLACVPIKETAAKLVLSIPCVFENRHKILCALMMMLDQEPERLSGTIEFDETYKLESQKGNRHIKRKARHRGEPSNYRGISHEQVCIVTTTDRNAHEIYKAVGFEKPTTNSILENFQGKLVKKSIIYVDGATSYNELAKKCHCSLLHLVTHKSYNQVEHLNTVNHIHSFIGRLYSNFKSVSTKYINRYMSLFVFIRRFMKLDDYERLNTILHKLKKLSFSITRKTLKTYQLMPVVGNF